MAAKRPAKKDGIPYQGDSLPWDSESEEAVLSCFLIDPGNLLPEAELTIPDDYFYHPGNQVIFKEMKAMLAMGKPVEYTALTGWLRDKDALERIGGPVYLSKVLNSMHSAATFNHYRSRLKDKYLLRAGITLCDTTASEGRSFHGEDASEWTGKLAAEALQLHQTAIQVGGLHQGADLEQAHDEMVRRGDQVGIPTQFPWFNKKFGGCFPGTVIFFAGDRGIGKSALTRQIGWYTAGKLKEPTEVITFEMDRVQEFRRICSLEGVHNNAWLTNQFSDQELEIIKNVKRAAKSIPYKIHDDVDTLDQAVNRIKMGFLKRGTRLWIFDSPQALEENSRDSRERELSRIGKALKKVAKDLGLCIMCPAHLNEGGDARGSKDLENFCDVFCRLGRDADHKPTFMEPWRRILARLSKNRNGPEEDEGLLLRFTGQHLRFEEESTTNMEFKKPRTFRN